MVVEAALSIQSVIDYFFGGGRQGKFVLFIYYYKGLFLSPLHLKKVVFLKILSPLISPHSSQKAKFPYEKKAEYIDVS